MVDRRGFLEASAKLTLLASFARVAAGAANADARFALVILRGGLDGLAAVPAYGEGRYASLRGPLALAGPGAGDGVLDLDGLFGLHPSLGGLHALYRARELAVLHAIATPYRERSHFDGQKVLENGGATPATAAGGWLNRALIELEARGTPRDAVALAESVPLVLRGSFVVSAWTPSRLPDADGDLLARVQSMYSAADPALAARLNEALEARALIGDTGGQSMGGRARRGIMPLVTAAARFLSEPDGPRIAVIDVGGWDTHANQGAAEGNLAFRLRALDTALTGFKSELGKHWESTSVLVVTEFGRTVAANGTRGTDHGTAGCAFLAGGAVAGGRVVTDWPGLGANDLLEGRDLKPTLDLRAVAKGVLADRFGLPGAALERVFPDSREIAPLSLHA